MALEGMFHLSKYFILSKENRQHSVIFGKCCFTYPISGKNKIKVIYSLLHCTPAHPDPQTKCSNLMALFHIKLHA
jgi:hypothetical protein